MTPEEIEQESMRIIQNKIGKYLGPVENLPIIKRVIHATADFDFLDNLYFSDNIVNIAHEVFKKRVPIVTDTLMLAAGISKKYNLKIICNIAYNDVMIEAKNRGVTRSIISIEHAVKNFPNAVYAIGNAPTALIRLSELIREAKANPAFVIGVPVGFVNVIEAKEMLSSIDVPKIISKGNKGGTTVACAIINALLYGIK